MALRDLLDDVLVPAQLVSHLDQRVEAHVDLGLTGGRDFVVLSLHDDPDLLHDHHHLLAKVLHGVGRRAGDVPLFVANLVAEVGLFVAAAVPDPLDRVDQVVGRVRVAVVADVVEHEELRLRAEVRGVSKSGRLQVCFRLVRDRARAARVLFLGDRVDDVPHHDERRMLEERVHHRSARGRNHQHVGSVDGLPTTDRGSVKTEAVLEDVFVHFAHRYSEVLPRTEKIAEPKIYADGLLVLGELQDLFRIHSACSPFFACNFTGCRLLTADRAL